MTDETEELLVDVGGPEAMSMPGAMMTPLNDGGIFVDFDPDAEPQGVVDDGDHFANLAEGLQETALNTIAQDVEEMYPALVGRRDGFKTVRYDGLPYAVRRMIAPLKQEVHHARVH